MSGPEDLGAELTGLGYDRLFLGTPPDDLDHLWARPGAAEAFRAVVAAPGEPLEARFLAALALASRGVAPDDTAVACVLVDALRAGVLPEANPWFVPGVGPGDAGRCIVALGAAAEPALRDALGDTAPVAYGGSREATLAESYGFRVCDVAAALLGEISGRSFPVTPDVAARDRAVAALRDRGRR